MSHASKFWLTKLVAYFAHPYLDLPNQIAKLHFSKEDEDQVFDLLKSNKVLLRSVNYDDYTHFRIKSDIMAKLVNRSSLFRNSYNYALNLKQQLLNVVAKFNERGINSIFVKSLNTLPLDSDNFDILVKEEDLSTSINVLKDMGFVELAWVREPFKWLFRYVKEVKDYLAVHLHTAVGWEGMRFVDVGDLWKDYRKLEIGGVAVGMPSQENHLLITLAHAFFENHKFGLNDLTYVIEDIYSKRLDWDYITSWIIEDHWFDSFHGMLSLTDHVYRTLFNNALIPEIANKKLDGRSTTNTNRLLESLIQEFEENLSLPLRIPITTVASHYVKKIVSEPHVSYIKKMETIFSISKRFLERKMPIRRNRPAFSVCFIGQDGTGKTLHARYIAKELKKRGIRVKYVWSRGTGQFFGPFLYLLRSVLLNGKILNEHKKENKGRRESLLRKEPLKSMWSYTLLADHLAKLMRIKFALASGSMVICDRYIFDTLIDVKCDLGKDFNGVLRKIAERLAPQPKLIFMMDIEPSDLVKRKPGMKLDLVEKKRSAYLDYFRDKDCVSTIDTYDDLNRNRERILSIVLQTFYGYYE